MADTADRQGLAGLLSPREMNTLGRLALRSRLAVEGNLAGAHRSPLRGAGSEFADHKAYAIGDEIKHIDWKVLARSERYFVKRFQDETNLRVYLVIDRSRSMAYAGNGVSKYAYACRLAAALGYVTVKARDSVGLFLHAERIDLQMPARNTLAHLNDLLRRLLAFEPDAVTDIHDALHRVADAVHRRALIVVLSDLLGDEERIKTALSHFRRRHHDVIVFQILDPKELDLSYAGSCLFEDLETGETMAADPRGMAEEYERLMAMFLEQYRRRCAELRIDYRLAQTDGKIETFVRAYLDERRRLSR